MSDELRKELREVQKDQAEWVSIESDIERVIIETRPGSLWHRFFSWLLRKAASNRKDLAAERVEIEKKMRG